MNSSTPKKRIRAIQSLLRQFVVWPESDEEALGWYEEAWFKNPGWRFVMHEPLNALRTGNPTPLRRHIDILGPRVLADPLVQLELQKLWVQKFLDSSEGARARKCLRALFRGMGDPAGRPERQRSALEKQKQGQDRQAQYREKEKAAKAALLKAITKAKKKVPSAGKDWRRRRADEAKSEEAEIEKALHSTDPHLRKTAKALKKQRDRGLSGPGA